MRQSPLNKTPQDKFRMAFTIPEALRRLNSQSQRESNLINESALEFSLFNVDIPRQRIREKELTYGGSTMKISKMHREPYDPVKMDFVVDNRYNNYWVVHRWLAFINDPETGLFDSKGLARTGQSLKEYSTLITIFAADEYDNNVIKWDYHGAFPTELSNIRFDYKEDAKISCSVSFAFSRMNVNLIDINDGESLATITP